MSVESTYEVTLLDPLIEAEFEWLAEKLTKNGDTIAMNSSGRILLWETELEIEDVIEMLAKYGVADDVGLIRKITEYEPERPMIMIDFEPDFDLGDDK